MERVQMSGDRIEVEAWRDLFEAGGPDLKQRLGLRVESIGRATLFLAEGVDSLLFNRAVGASSSREVRLAVDAFEGAGIGRYFVQPSVRLADLEELGLAPYHRHWMKFERGSGPIPRPRTELAIEPARSEHAELAAGVLVDGFDLPEVALPILASLVDRSRWEIHVALDRDEVAGVGALFVDGADGYLAFAATRPGHRRRGIQGALMSRRLVRAFELGATRVHTETGEAVEGEANSSYRNMLRHGFHPTRLRENHAPPGTRWRETG